jgi:hypothetical protein
MKKRAGCSHKNDEEINELDAVIRRMKKELDAVIRIN